MPETGQCIHTVDFDDFEIVHKKRQRHMIRVGCKKCHTGVTLDDVLSSLASKAYDLDARLRKLEGDGGGGDGESVSGTDT